MSLNAGILTYWNRKFVQPFPDVCGMKGLSASRVSERDATTACSKMTMCRGLSLNPLPPVHSQARPAGTLYKHLVKSRFSPFRVEDINAHVLRHHKTSEFCIRSSKYRISLQKCMIE